MQAMHVDSPAQLTVNPSVQKSEILTMGAIHWRMAGLYLDHLEDSISVPAPFNPSPHIKECAPTHPDAQREVWTSIPQLSQLPHRHWWVPQPQ